MVLGRGHRPRLEEKEPQRAQQQPNQQDVTAGNPPCGPGPCARKEDGQHRQCSKREVARDPPRAHFDLDLDGGVRGAGRVWVLLGHGKARGKAVDGDRADQYEAPHAGPSRKRHCPFDEIEVRRALRCRIAAVSRPHGRCVDHDVGGRD